MKAVIILLLCSLSVQAQVAESAEFELAVSGYTNGKYDVVVRNKMNCKLEPLRVSWLQNGSNKDTTFPVQALQTFYFQLPAPNNGSTIKIKSDAPCSSTGWLSVEVFSALAITDNRIRYHRRLPPNSRVLYNLDGSYRGSFYDGQQLPKGLYIVYRNNQSDLLFIH